MSKVDTDVTTTITNVTSKLVRNGTLTLWEVETPDGTKWTTAKAEVANTAIALIGHVADMKCSIQQKDQYTNYYVNSIRQTTSAQPLPATTPAGQAVQQAQQAQAAGPQQQTVSYDQYKDLEADKETRRNASIHRQTAAKVAAALLPETPEDFWASVEELTRFFATGVIASRNNVQQGVTSHTPPPTQNDPGDAYYEATQQTDDDIPF